VNRWVILGATVCNALLVGAAASFVYRDFRRREQLATSLREQRAQFERAVEARTRELVELSTHLQSVAEREKATLARELHDELGGLLVGARMDISWAEQRLNVQDIELRHRLSRVQQNLSAGIDLKRRIIEELRPTLLDNVGFIAALRWQFKETCARAGLKCTEYFPDEEPKFTADAAIALFRVAQEAFAHLTERPGGATAVDISLDIDEDAVVFRVNAAGSGLREAQVERGPQGLAAMKHRVLALGGTFDYKDGAADGTILTVRIPTERALRPVAEPEIS
jgi:signal transduction histidine kinase